MTLPVLPPLVAYTAAVEAAGDALADLRGPVLDDAQRAEIDRARTDALLLAGQARRLERLLRRAVLQAREAER